MICNRLIEAKEKYSFLEEGKLHIYQDLFGRQAPNALNLKNSLEAFGSNYLSWPNLPPKESI